MILTVENRKRNQLKEMMFYIGILTLITVVLWIALSIYITFSKTSIDPKMAELTKPINPVLDSQSLIEYESTRVAAPEQFSITVMVKNDDKKLSTKEVVDIFNQENASPSAR